MKQQRQGFMIIMIDLHNCFGVNYLCHQWGNSTNPTNLQKLHCKHEFFNERIFTIFLVKMKLSSVKICKTVAFSWFFYQKNFRIFSRQIDGSHNNQNCCIFTNFFDYHDILRIFVKSWKNCKNFRSEEHKYLHVNYAIDVMSLKSL